MSKEIRNVWKEFENGKIVVECRKPHELNEFVKELKRRGFRWFVSDILPPQMLKLMCTKLPIYIYIESCSGEWRLLYSTNGCWFDSNKIDILWYNDFMAEDYKFINSDANKRIIIEFNVDNGSFGADAKIYNKNCVCTNRFESHGFRQDPFDCALKAIKVFEKRRDEALKNKDRTDSLVEGIKHAATYECVYGMCTRWSDGDLHKLFCDTDAKKYKPSKWDEFKAGKFSVEVNATNILLFLKECEEQGLAWVSGDRALKYIPEFVAKAGGNGYMIYNDTLKRLQCLRYYAYSGMALTYDEFAKRD